MTTAVMKESFWVEFPSNGIYFSAHDWQTNWLTTQNKIYFTHKSIFLCHMEYMYMSRDIHIRRPSKTIVQIRCLLV